MGQLLDEYREWNTPVVGAYLLWRFTKAYMEKRTDGVPPSFLLHCVAAAILSSPTYTEIIGHARSLHRYSQYFIEHGLADKLEKLHQRVGRMLPYTKKAVDIAVHRQILVWDIQNGSLLPIDIGKPKRGSSTLSTSVMAIAKRADTLGGWLASADLNTITIELGVRF